MLTNQVVQLVDQIELKKTLMSQKRNIQAFRTRRNQLVSLSNKVETVLKTFLVFKESEIDTPDFSGQLMDAVKKLQEIQQRYEIDPSWVGDQNALDPLTRKIEKLITDMTNSFSTEWQNFVLKQVPNLNNEILSVLEKIPSFKKIVGDVKVLYHEIQQGIVNLPLSKKDVLKVKEQCHTLNRKWNELGADDVPKEVLFFLRSLSSGRGASLSMLTDDVLSWLKQNEIEKYISIKIIG